MGSSFRHQDTKLGALVLSSGLLVLSPNLQFQTPDTRLGFWLLVPSSGTGLQATDLGFVLQTPNSRFGVLCSGFLWHLSNQAERQWPPWLVGLSLPTHLSLYSILAAGTLGRPGGGMLVQWHFSFLCLCSIPQASSLEIRAEMVTEHPSLKTLQELQDTYTYSCSQLFLDPMVDTSGAPCSCAVSWVCAQLWLHLIQHNPPCVFLPIGAFLSL